MAYVKWTILAVASLMASGASGQSLEDVLAATEEQAQTEAEPEAHEDPRATGSVITKPPRRRPETPDIDMSLFDLESAAPHADDLSTALRLLAYLEHQVASAPDTPMSMRHRLPGHGAERAE